MTKLLINMHAVVKIREPKVEVEVYFHHAQNLQIN